MCSLSPFHEIMVKGKTALSGLLLIFVCSILACISLSPTPAFAQTSHTGSGGSGPGLTISAPAPPSGPPGATLVVTGSGLNAGDQITLSIGKTDGTCASATPVNGAVGTVNGTGSVSIRFTWPPLAPGAYPVCAFGSNLPTTGLVSDNLFTQIGQATPSITISPSQAKPGDTVTVSGVNFVPGGVGVEVYVAQQGTTQGCGARVDGTTSNDSGSFTLTFPAPNPASTTSYTVTAASPAGSCNSDIGPTLRATATLTVNGGSGAGTPGSGSTPTATPTPGQLTPISGTQTATPTRTAGGGTGGTKTPGPGTPAPTVSPGKPSSQCPPFPNSLCTAAGIPWWILCLLLLLLLALLIWLFIALARRRNEVVTTREEDITSQIDPNSINTNVPDGMQLHRVVRIVTTTSDRNTGRVIRERARVVEEFIDSAGNIRQRTRA